MLVSSQVVEAARTQDVATRWGREATVAIQKPMAGSDPQEHVIAGDIRSPAENGRTIEAFVQFINGLKYGLDIIQLKSESIISYVSNTRTCRSNSSWTSKS